MISVEEMRELLKTDYGISTDAELVEALDKANINIALFVMPKPDVLNEKDHSA